jgi:hypothetical protein
VIEPADQSKQPTNDQAGGAGSGLTERVMPQSCKEAPNVRRAIIAFWRTLARDLADPYRPELHYMRGPGPKWREKYGQAAPEVGHIGPRTTSAETDGVMLLA